MLQETDETLSIIREMVLEGHTTDGRGFEDKLKNKEFSLREEEYL